MIKLLVFARDGSYQDISNLLGRVAWSGDYKTVCRRLEFNYAADGQDSYVPRVNLELGYRVKFYENSGDAEELFDGYVFERAKGTGDDGIRVVCFDRGIYLKRNEAVYRFEGMTAAEITGKVCSDFQVEYDALPASGHTITRNFIGDTLYNIIQTCWNLTGAADGKKYLINFKADRLRVLSDAEFAPLIFRSSSNLLNASVTESVQNMVNRVNIYDSADTLIQTVENAENVRLYGLMQDYMKQSSGKDAPKEAEKALKEKGVNQKITVQGMGNTTCITGQSVYVEEPYTGLIGIFWIEADVHEWNDGVYSVKLTLNLERMADDVESGTA